MLKGGCCDRPNRACCRPVARHGAKSGACFLHAGMQPLELSEKFGEGVAYDDWRCALFRAYPSGLQVRPTQLQCKLLLVSSIGRVL